MRIKGARIFLSKFFGGKFEILKQPSARIKPTKITK